MDFLASEEKRKVRLITRYKRKEEQEERREDKRNDGK